MSTPRPTGAEHPLGEIAPALIAFTGEVLFGQVWERDVLSPTERSLVTVACLVASGNPDQLVYHLRRARDNGATQAELVRGDHAPRLRRGMAAMAVAKEVFSADAG